MQDLSMCKHGNAAQVQLHMRLFRALASNAEVRHIYLAVCPHAGTEWERPHLTLPACGCAACEEAAQLGASSATMRQLLQRQREDEPAVVRVNTTAALQKAMASDAAHIHIEAHLDLRSLRTQAPRNNPGLDENVKVLFYAPSKLQALTVRGSVMHLHHVHVVQRTCVL